MRHSFASGSNVASTLTAVDLVKQVNNQSVSNLILTVCVAQTLNASMDNQTDLPLVHIYDNHPSDSRVTESKGVCHTLTSKMGTGGGNVPFVLMDQGGSQMSIETDKVGTLRAQEHGHQPIVYRIDSDASNAMKSSNPHSGVHEVAVSPTLDTTIPTPAKGQGGIAVCIAENVIGRKVENGGNGVGAQEDISYTLNATGVHGVAYRADVYNGQKTGCKSATVTAASGASPTHSGPSVIQGQVRRLTPVECERLQGFPDNYTRIPYRGKPEEDCPDGPRYKAIGNSWAVPVVRWIGKRIKRELGE